MDQSLKCKGPNPPHKWISLIVESVSWWVTLSVGFLRVRIVWIFLNIQKTKKFQNAHHWTRYARPVRAFWNFFVFWIFKKIQTTEPLRRTRGRGSDTMCHICPPTILTIHLCLECDTVTYLSPSPYTCFLLKVWQCDIFVPPLTPIGWGPKMVWNMPLCLGCDTVTYLSPSPSYTWLLE